MSKDPWSCLTTSSSQSKHYPLALENRHIYYSPLHRYAEIVNVRLGDGSIRKGQVLEIAGKRAVVQVSLLSRSFARSAFLSSWNRSVSWQDFHFRSSKEHQESIICTLTSSSLVMCSECPSVLKCSADLSTVQVHQLTTVPQSLLKSSWISR